MFKKIWWPELGPNGPKFGQKLGVFLPLSQVWFGSSRGKNHKKNLSKSGSKPGFLSFSQVWFIIVFLEIACNDSLQQYRTSSRGKTQVKIFGDQI